MSRKSKHIKVHAVIFIFVAFSLSALIALNFALAREREGRSGSAEETKVGKQQEVKVDVAESNDVEADVIDGEADEFEQNEKTGITVLIGNVEIKRKSGYLNADKVTIYKNVDTREVLRTVAEGNVDMKDGEILATCERAVLNEADDTIELTGKVVVTQDGDRVESPNISYDRKTGIRKGKGNANQRVKFRVRLKAKEVTTTEETPSEEGKK